MLKLLVFILIFCTWQVLLDQCCKTKILNGKEYQLRETNDEAVSKYGCQDNCVFEDFENKLFCFKPGSFPAECLTPTTTSNEIERGFTNVTVLDDKQGYFCNLNFGYTINKTFKLESESMTTCVPWTDLSDSSKFLEEKLFQVQSSKGLVLNCKMTPIFTSSETGSISFANKAVHKTLNCEVSTESCLTNNGSVYPAKCEPTFRYNGREYHACTDQDLSEDDNRLWCATKVDENYNLLDGHWGYCSPKCSYCRGSPVNGTNNRAFPQPCGYDCLVNPGKVMDGSLGTNNVPLLKPIADLYGEVEDNFIRDVKGQIQLDVGKQVVKLYCPMSKFIDPALKTSQTVLAVCGPKQYRFTVYSITGALLHEEFKNNRFGCDPCPNNYHYVPGYLSSTDCSHRGTSFNIKNIDVCEDRCFNTKSCKSFSFSKKDRTCKLFSKLIVNPTYISIYKDYAICSKDAGCCEKLTISSTGGTSQFQSTRLGNYVGFGRHNNRILYKQEEGTKILFYAGYKNYGWVVASHLDSLGGLRTLSYSESVCPDEELKWEYYTGSTWVEDETIIISCGGPGLSNIEEFKRGWQEEIKVVMDNGEYNSFSYQNQNDAHEILAKSIWKNDQIKGYIAFKHTILPKVDVGSINSLPFVGRNMKTEIVYELPIENRLRHTVYEIGYLMMQYGIINPMFPEHDIIPSNDDEESQEDVKINQQTGFQKRKLLKVGPIVYEILLRRLDNLYVNPVACIYDDEKGPLTEANCKSIKNAFNVKETKTNAMTYGKFKEGIPNANMIYNALKGIFTPEKNTILEPETIDYYKTDIYEAFLADYFSVVILVEIVRNIEMLPVTLELLTLGNAKIDSGKIPELMNRHPIEIHPMTQGGSFFNKYRELYQTANDEWMNVVGFYQFQDGYTGFQQTFRTNLGTDLVKDAVKGALKVHKRVIDVSKEFKTLFSPSIMEIFFQDIPKDSTSKLLVSNAFFKRNTKEEDEEEAKEEETCDLAKKTRVF